jgi:hypothetical protein
MTEPGTPADTPDRTLAPAPTPAPAAAFPPLILGAAGLLPQGAAVLAAAFGGPKLYYTALAIGYAYAVLIFSFLGGLWWGLAAGGAARVGIGATRGEKVPGWLWVAAVCPSLIALLSFMPWVYGHPWPGPSLILIGLCIAASPLIDGKIVAHPAIPTPPWWMRLRWALSLGLGSATLALGLIAQR